MGGGGGGGKYANVQSRAPTVISGDPQQPLQLASGRSQNPSWAEVMMAGNVWSRNKRGQNQKLGREGLFHARQCSHSELASESIGREGCNSLGHLAVFLCFFCSLGWSKGRPSCPGLREARPSRYTAQTSTCQAVLCMEAAD